MERFSISVGLGPNTARYRFCKRVVAPGDVSSLAATAPPIDRQLDFEAKKAVFCSFVREMVGFRWRTEYTIFPNTEAKEGHGRTRSARN